MSTTITPAYKLVPGADLFSLIQAVRIEIAPLLRKAVMEQYVSEAILQWDQDTEEKTLTAVLSDLLRTNWDKPEDAEELWYNKWFKAEVKFYKNYVRDEVYVILNNFSDAAVDRFGQLPEVEGDFSYWNGSDSQVESLGRAGWKDRQKAWDETIKRNDVVPQALVGRLFSVYGAKLLKLSDFREAWNDFDFPSREARYKNALYTVYVSLAQAKINELYPEDDVSSWVGAAVRYLSTDKNIEEALPYSEELPELVEQAVARVNDILEVKAFPELS